MNLKISTTEGVPIYLQIVRQIRQLVGSGGLGPGEELPPIRTLAETLLVNPNTVARAYRELELAGVVEKRRTTGTYVAESVTRTPRREHLKALAERVDALLVDARQMGVEPDEVIELIRKRQEALWSA